MIVAKTTESAREIENKGKGRDVRARVCCPALPYADVVDTFARGPTSCDTGSPVRQAEQSHRPSLILILFSGSIPTRQTTLGMWYTTHR
jgi:hypothetical protein